MRAVYTLSGILILALIATGLTEATLAVGHRGNLSDEAALVSKATVTPRATAKPTPTPTAIPTTAPTVAPVPTATTSSFVHMRAGASTGTPIVADLNAGTVVTLGGYRDSQWQQVTYNGLNGYIFRTYLNY